MFNTTCLRTGFLSPLVSSLFSRLPNVIVLLCLDCELNKELLEFLIAVIDNKLLKSIQLEKEYMILMRTHW